MKCPYCGEEMRNGMLIGDGRAKVRWQSSDNKIDMFDKMVTEKGCIDAKYSLTKFEIMSDYCDKCSKIIIETKVRN